MRRHRARPILVWPWRQGNEVQLLREGEQFFARMLGAIEAARQYVLLEMYLLESGIIASRFIETLAHSAARGVHVAAIFDGYGSLGLLAGDRARLLNAGVKLQIYNGLHWRKWLRNFMRDHRKLLLVDGEIAFVGGAGLADAFAVARARGTPWREIMLEVRGPAVGDWQAAFLQTWNRNADDLALPMPPDRLARAHGVPGRVVLSAGWRRSPLANEVVARIRTARRRVWIMSAYFVPSRRFRKAMRQAARRGVDVRLLVPGALTDHPWVRHAARRFYGRMLRMGVRIFEYQPHMLHGKMTLCDDWASIGSSNLDRWSFKWNLEANQEIDAAPFAELLANSFEDDLGRSKELDPRRWGKRAWLDRAREWVAGALDRWVERWRPPPP
jgi:phosphatidylserine/phosphatidylglycerophosphate/cardiolipin synthase-like enzyme